MSGDAKCERDVVTEILNSEDDWDIYFTNGCYLVAHKIDVAKKVKYDQLFSFYHCDGDFYRRCRLHGFRTKNDVIFKGLFTENGVSHLHEQTVDKLSPREKWAFQLRKEKDFNRYMKIWGDNPFDVSLSGIIQ